MADRKETRKYTFTVEGVTDKWYLEWLQTQVNTCEDAAYKISIVAPIVQSPKSFAKTINAKSTPCVVHLCDIESTEDHHIQKFHHILSELNTAKKGKGIQYLLGYSNFTFELWMILHKQDCNGPLTNRAQYLQRINRAFGENFESLTKYKSEPNFKRCLSKLTLQNVRDAISRSKNIMNAKKENDDRKISHCGFKYYQENPSLTIWESIEEILKVCNLMN